MVTGLRDEISRGILVFGRKCMVESAFISRKRFDESKWFEDFNRSGFFFFLWQLWNSQGPFS